MRACSMLLIAIDTVVVAYLKESAKAFQLWSKRRTLRKLWRQKAWWPVSWDQSALAESVLELIGWVWGVGAAI